MQPITITPATGTHGTYLTQFPPIVCALRRPACATVNVTRSPAQDRARVEISHDNGVTYTECSAPELRAVAAALLGAAIEIEQHPAARRRATLDRLVTEGAAL